MAGTIKLKVPQLLEERNLSPMDLLYGARLAPATAYRLAEGKGDRITFNVLIKLCGYFNVAVGDILEYEPKGNGKH